MQVAAGTSQREHRVPRTRDKMENSRLWELTAVLCASSVDSGWRVKAWMGSEGGLAEEWEMMKLGR